MHEENTVFFMSCRELLALMKDGLSNDQVVALRDADFTAVSAGRVLRKMLKARLQP